MSTTVRLIRAFPIQDEEDYGTFTIQSREPRTPQILQKAGEIAQFSSPIDHYNLIYIQQPSSPLLTYNVQHKESHRLRLMEVKDNTTKLEDRLRVIEREIEDQKRLNEAQMKLILEWETCDRLVQGLNDYIKDTVLGKQTGKENLSSAKIIWSQYNQNRYLPYLFTQWWLMWNTKCPNAYRLPDSFATLTASDMANFQSRQHLADEISDVLELLWESSLQPTIELMLLLFFNRPKGRNNLQHPIPTADFALSYITSVTKLSEKQKSEAEHIINNGRKRDGTHFFTQSPPAPAPHATGTARGTTRQREDDDDGSRGMGVKRHRGE